jgi:Rieske Fe-S protein
MADEGLTRRRLLDGALAAACLGCAAVAGCATLPYLLPAPSRRRAGPVAVATLDQIPPEGALAVPFGRGRALIVKRGDALAAFDPACTHARCLVEWRPDQSRFRCPCHGGVFDADGRPVSGPPRQPLAKFELRVRGRRIILE